MIPNGCIPTSHSTFSDASVSHDLLSFRLTLFPVIWHKNPTWVISSVLVIMSNIAQ